ncbi:MAG: M24 family metallopeptidase [Alphaproteobacteria bacterium]|nr:M24 family metallopeptidase [Alphaproteobacteria bacterium]MDD9919288.1 M24 family metallopeptidase [Alphaproteobacteria bacterium]
MKTARLLYSCDADWYYATDIHVSDPAPWCQITDGKTHACVSALEFGLTQSHPHKVDTVHSMPSLSQRDKDLPPLLGTFKYMLDHADWPDVIEVPANFPAQIFVQMKEAGWPVTVVDDPFFPTRPLKTAAEIEKIRHAQHINEAGVAHLRTILAEAEIGLENKLFWQGQPLTSEVLKGELGSFLLKQGCDDFGGGPIIAGGAQSATPHDRGHGQLYAHQFIIIDSFPRGPENYYGDLTRTYLKGTPTQWHKDVYAAVLAGQEAGLNALKAGITGEYVHKHVVDTIAGYGFETGQTEDGTPYGFFHSTGHHLGLEVHDVGGRMLSVGGPELKAGMVTSVEPGLYYPPSTYNNHFGGCRIEDIAAITEEGHDNLTTLPKDDWIVD